MNNQKTTLSSSLPAKPSFGRFARSFLPRILNAALWLVFCVLSGSGLLLALRLPPGSRGGRGLFAYGLSRHEWGDIHTWFAYGFIALIFAHLVLHWRWFWQVAARRSSVPLLVGLGAGLALAITIFFAPLTKNSRAGKPAHVYEKGLTGNAGWRGGGRGHE